MTVIDNNTREWDKYKNTVVLIPELVPTSFHRGEIKVESQAHATELRMADKINGNQFLVVQHMMSVVTTKPVYLVDEATWDQNNDIAPCHKITDELMTYIKSCSRL
ncbi:hypothetical protein GR11A_00089 [Vibrio phage vB_VcorM_GR11A]|nr:hypothetical protein GR11A_00089 [Vibrio phage vB_VcorM_GR11A]